MIQLKNLRSGQRKIFDPADTHTHSIGYFIFKKFQNPNQQNILKIR